MNTLDVVEYLIKQGRKDLAEVVLDELKQRPLTPIISQPIVVVPHAIPTPSPWWQPPTITCGGGLHYQ